MSVRRGAEADLERVAALAGEVLPEAGSAASLADTLAGPAAELWVGGRETEEPAIEAFLVALRVGTELEVLWLGVAPGARRVGLATALLESALAGAGSCHLEVSVARPGAQAFYRERGFVEVGRRRAYHPGGDDAIRMQWVVEAAPEG